MTMLRTIPLTDTPPVRIDYDLWPIIASMASDSGRSHDLARREQLDGTYDRYMLMVRQHADGRVLVYGVLTAASTEHRAPAGGKSWRGGELFGASADVVAAIRKVGASAGMPDDVIHQCIEDLPAENLD